MFVGFAFVCLIKFCHILNGAGSEALNSNRWLEGFVLKIALTQKESEKVIFDLPTVNWLHVAVARRGNVSESER